MNWLSVNKRGTPVPARLRSFHIRQRVFLSLCHHGDLYTWTSFWVRVNFTVITPEVDLRIGDSPLTVLSRSWDIAICIWRVLCHLDKHLCHKDSWRYVLQRWIHWLCVYLAWTIYLQKGRTFLRPILDILSDLFLKKKLHWNYILVMDRWLHFF